MAVIITGGCGFIGARLGALFAKNGKEVVAVDFAPPSDLTKEIWAGGVEYEQCDISNKERVASIVKAAGDKDEILHLAAILTAGCDKDPSRAVNVNIGGFVNLIDPIREHEGRRLLLASTIGVYGRGLPQPITESMATEPDGWYGATKICDEEIGLLAARRYGIDFRAARMAAVTGPNRVAVGSASMFVSLIPEKAAKGEPYAIEVSEDTSYPAVYIDDAVDALYTIVTAPEAPSRIYNVASGNAVVSEMVKLVKERRPDADLSYAPDPDIMAVVSGYKEWTIDCSLAKKELGWKPSFTLPEMVRDIMEKATP